MGVRVRFRITGKHASIEDLNEYPSCSVTTHRSTLLQLSIFAFWRMLLSKHYGKDKVVMSLLFPLLVKEKGLHFHYTPTKYGQSISTDIFYSEKVQNVEITHMALVVKCEAKWKFCIQKSHLLSV